MNLQKCYSELGGAFEEVRQRLFSEALVMKFVLKFLDDQSFAQLCDAIEKSDYPKAFMASHTLKGICQNLAFTRLYTSSHLLTEALSGESPDIAAAKELFKKVQEDYRITADAIRRMQEEE